MKKRFVLLVLVSHIAFGQEAKDSDNAVALMNAGKYAEAIPILDRLVKANPGTTVYAYNRAISLTHLKKYSAALADYRSLHKAIPDEPEYVLQSAIMLDKLDSAAKAEVLYTQAIEMDRKEFEYYFLRGTFYVKRKEYSKALNDLNESLRLNPKHHNSLHNRGIARYKLGFKDEACQDWCQAFLLGNTVSLSHIEKNCEHYPSECLKK